MKRLTSTKSPIAWHLCYLALIAASIFWLLQQGHRHRAELADQVKIDRLLSESLDREARSEMNRLEKEMRDYPDQRNEYLFSLGHQLDSLSASWRTLTDQFSRQVINLADFTQKSNALLAVLQTVANQDTLTANVYAKAWPNWSTAAWQPHLSSSNTPDERRALLLSSEIQVSSALYLTLDHLNRQMAFERYSMKGFTVVPLVFTEGIPRVGEPCRLDFSSGMAASDPQGDSLVRIFVNGREYPVERGLAHYEQKFDTPGEHVLNVEARLQSPFDSTQVQVMRREFRVTVLPKGR